MGRKLKKIKVLTAPKYENAAKEMEKIDRDVLIDVLLGAGDHGETMKFVNLGNMLSDERECRRYSLVEMCAMNQIGIKDVAALFKTDMLALATIQQMRHAPDILESNAKAAIGKRVPCPTCEGNKRVLQKCLMCDGAGKTEEGPCVSCKGAGSIDVGPCETCHATGWVQMAGDPVALKVFADSAGLTAKSGPLVNINQNFGAGAGSFEELMRQSDKIVDVKASE